MDKGTMQDFIDDLMGERERLQTTLDSMAERNQKQNAEQLRIVRAVEADRDRWRSIAERAMENLETAVKLLEDLRQAVHRV